jgi:hypothetical protein
MKKKMSLKQLVELLIDCITWGIDIHIDADSEVKTIKVHDTIDGKTVKFSFEVPCRGWCKVGNWEETTEPVNKPED